MPLPDAKQVASLYRAAVRNTPPLQQAAFFFSLFLRGLETPVVRVQGYFAAALEKLLPPGIFVRCQRSFLVNLCHAAQAAGGELILSDGTRLPLGRKVRDRVIEAYEAVRSARTGGGPRSKGAYENDFCCDL